LTSNGSDNNEMERPVVKSNQIKIFIWTNIQQI
jgi:hypothetical protein